VRSAERDCGFVSSGGCLSWLASGGSGAPSTDIFRHTQTMTRVAYVAIACGLYVQAGPFFFARVDRKTQLLSGLILTPVVAEFGFKPPYLSLALNIGLFVGAVTWGIGCDVWGRRWSFNVTLFLTGVFGLASGGSGNFITLASLFAVCGFGVGGNLPVDSAVFLGQCLHLRPLRVLFLSD
jgi:MFS family permease